MNQQYSAIHHKLWDNCQILSMPFAVFMVLYRLVYGAWNLNNYYFPETIASHKEVLRFYTLSNLPVDPYEASKRRHKYSHLPTLQRSALDSAYFLYISTGIVYYYYDLFHKLITVGVTQLDFCGWAYIFHHLLTIFNYKFYGSLYYYSWYLMLPSAYHSVLIAFPKFYWNYHIYGVSLATFTFSQLCFETMRSTRLHKYLTLSVPIMAPSIIMIAIGRCQV